MRPASESIGAGQHARELGSTGAEQPGDADDLAGAQAEADVVQRAVAAEPLDLQQLLAGRHAALGKVIFEIAIGHQSHQRVDRHLRQRRRRHMPCRPARR